ncbi:hypothetical protein I79_020727 [Cricetulus griseus]|uniref:Uncharacterized protein n=1 Tax=Cricetulus griseus TaxID=10029 RepID=G3IAU5_CRIGR|nr:hypothetical protein I79_020727 [Cricetulus griseus]
MIAQHAVHNIPKSLLKSLPTIQAVHTDTGPSNWNLKRAKWIGNTKSAQICCVLGGMVGEHTSGLWPQLSSGRATLTPPPGRRRLLRLRFRPPGHRRRRHSASGLLPAGPGPAPLHLDPLSGRQSPVSCIDPEAAFGGPPNNNT